jgi:hypothetical protein
VCAPGSQPAAPAVVPSSAVPSSAVPSSAVPSSAAEALAAVGAGLEYLAGADVGEWPAETLAGCLRALGRAESAQVAVQSRVLRWKTRDDMLRATVRHRGAASPPPAPDTGTLRGDLLALLSHANTDHNPMAALVSSMLGSYYNKSGPTPAELRAEFRGQRGPAVEEVVSRAAGRGEVDLARLTPRILDLPFDLFRNEMMMTLSPVPDHVLRQIVDDIFIPLVTPRLPAR